MLLFIMSEIIIMKKHIPRRNKRNIHKAMSKNKKKQTKITDYKLKGYKKNIKTWKHDRTELK